MKKTLLYKIALIFLASSLSLLSGCSQEKDDRPDQTIDGSAVIGVISNAQIIVRAIPNGHSGDLSGNSSVFETTTDSNGHFRLDQDITRSHSKTDSTVEESTVLESTIFIVELSAAEGSTMRCDLVSGCSNYEAGLSYLFGEDMPLPPDFVMYGVISGKHCHITPLSHMVVNSARDLPGGLTQTNLNAAEKWLRNTLSINHNVVSTRAADITALSETDYKDAEIDQGLWSASFYDLIHEATWKDLTIEDLPLKSIYRELTSLSGELAYQTDQADLKHYAEQIGEVAEVSADRFMAMSVEELSIVDHPESQNINEGEDIVLSVTTSFANLSYQWQKDGINIDGETSASLVISSAQLSDQGHYQVIVSNEAARSESLAANITIKEVIKPVAFLSHPTSQAISEGDPVHLSVAVSGDGPFTYQWQKSASLIPGANSSSFSISSSSLADAGSYRVTVTNATSVRSSNFANIIVTPRIAPVSILSHPQDITVTEDMAARFSVAANGDGLINYRWQKDGVDIPGENGPNLNLSNVTTDHQGSYRVIVSNSQGNEISTAATLTVLPSALPLNILAQPASQSVYEGDSATFVTSATGSGAIRYQWLFNGEEISGANGAIYSINRVTEQNLGTYQVMISDGTNTEMSSYAELTFSDPLELVLHWSIPEHREDGDSLDVSSIAGYVINYGPSSDQLDHTATIDDPMITEYRIGDLRAGTLVLRMATVDTEGLRSQFSTPISIQIQ